MKYFAVRGAISLSENTKEEILSKTKRLLEQKIQKNSFEYLVPYP